MFLEGDAAENVYDEEEFKLLTELKEVDRKCYPFRDAVNLIFRFTVPNHSLFQIKE